MTTKINLGEVLPPIELPMTNKQIFDPKNCRGQYLILYFYPKDATPGCTIEGQQFSQLKNKFNKLNAKIYGVSRDSIQSHESFRQKQCLTIDLISDVDEKLCRMLDVMKEKNMYGKKVWGIERSTFIFDPQGQLIQQWRQVKADKHALEVYDWLSQHLKSVK